jgi:hypothetical protein
MSPAEASVKVEWATDDDLRAAATALLADLGITLEELTEQAEAGQFSSEEARIAWFVISSFRDALAA